MSLAFEYSRGLLRSAAHISKFSAGPGMGICLPRDFRIVPRDLTVISLRRCNLISRSERQIGRTDPDKVRCQLNRNL
jgi:hypothetical protein